MPVAAVSASDDQRRAALALAPLIAALPAGAPVTVMIHGYRYAPGTRHDDPHATLFRQWARRLCFTDTRPGLAIGFGWNGTGMLPTAAGRALDVGDALARLIAGLRAEGAPSVNLIAHSLGARVALAALPGLAARDVGRVALLSGAVFRDEAEGLLATSAGQAAEVLNVTSRENDLFDLAFEMMLRGTGPSLGTGLDGAVTLQIDNAVHREGLRSLGFPVAPPRRLVCHWSAYTRPGLFPLYRAFLHRPVDLPFFRLRAALAQDPAPRWSRLFPRPLPSAAMPAQ